MTKRTFFADSVIYGLSSVLTLGVSFLLLPLYTHSLSTAEFGLYELLNKVSDVLFVFIFVGTTNSLVRFYFDKDTVDWRKTVSATSLLFNVASFIVICSFFLLIKDWFVVDVIRDEKAYQYVDLLLIYMFFELLHRIGVTLLQVNRLPGYYLIVHIFRAVVFVLLCLYLLLYDGRGIEGILLAQIFSCSVFAVGFFFYCIYWSKLNFSGELLVDLIRYGAPYLPATLFGIIASASDRFFLNEYSGLADVGVYALASKIGFIASLILGQSFAKSWGPYVFENFRKPGGTESIADIYVGYAKLLIILAFSIALASPIVIPIISSPDYYGAINLIPLMCLASLIQGLGMFADTGMLIAKKTEYKIVVGFYAALATVVANFVLTRHFGSHGAALAFMAGMGAFFAGNIYYSNRFHKLPIDWRLILEIVVLCSIVYAAYIAVVNLLPIRNSSGIIAIKTILAIFALLVALAIAVISGRISFSEIQYLSSQLLKFVGLNGKIRIKGKKIFLAKILCGRASPASAFMKRHRFDFPAILTYHRIFDAPSDYPMTRSVINATPAEFEAQLEYLSRNYITTNFQRLVEDIRRGRPIPGNSVVISFDDGYFDNCEFALPLLMKYGLTGTVFVSTGNVDSAKPFWVDLLAFQIFKMNPGPLSLLGGKYEFDVSHLNRNDVRVSVGRLCSKCTPSQHDQILNEVSAQTGINEIPEKFLRMCRPLSWSEIKKLENAGLEIASHCVSHRFLTQCDDDLLRSELVDSKSRLEHELQKSVVSVAFPAGDYDDRVLAAAINAGYQFGCIFDGRINDSAKGIDLARLSRMVVGNHEPLSLFRAKLAYPRLFLS